MSKLHQQSRADLLHERVCANFKDLVHSSTKPFSFFELLELGFNGGLVFVQEKVALNERRIARGKAMRDLKREDFFKKIKLVIVLGQISVSPSTREGNCLPLARRTHVHCRLHHFRSLF